ncbi:MAG: DUF3667 domain-containing protein [Flavobacteriaceae bacterium]
MECKNCLKSLRTDYSFCPNCGAKIIRNRITFNNLWHDVTERYFNWDNSFLKTIRDMVLQPETVCSSYILGQRKKYLNPISLLAITLTLSGFLLFVLKKIAWEELDFSSLSYGQNANQLKEMSSQTMEYSSFLTLSYIPILAVAGFLFFNKKNYNLPEHMVIGMYSLGTFTILSFPYSIITLIVAPQFYLDFALQYVLLMILFCTYISYRNSKYSLKEIIWRGPLYLLIFFFGYIGISILQFVVLLLTGTIGIADFAPQN